MQIQISWLLKKPTDLDLHFCKGRVYLGSAGQGLRQDLNFTFTSGQIKVPQIWRQCLNTKNLIRLHWYTDCSASSVFPHTTWLILLIETIWIIFTGGRVDMFNVAEEHVISGIFIKHVLEESPAGRNGTLKTGDRILQVGTSSVQVDNSNVQVGTSNVLWLG